MATHDHSAVRDPGAHQAEGRPPGGRGTSAVENAFGPVLVTLAQQLVVGDALDCPSDHFARRVAECVRARCPTLPERDFAQCVLIARRACVREILDGN